MSENVIAAPSAARPVNVAPSPERTVMAVLCSISLCHLLNDTIQSLLPAIYPILKQSYDLSFTQIGYLTLTFQCTASILQPVVGLYTDHRPKPYSLPFGMAFTLIGLLMLSSAGRFEALLLAAALVGLGSSVFHPEAARVARAASGGRYGLAQSIFQVGGNAGSAIGPLLAAFIVVPFGQRSVSWFGVLALIAAVILTGVSRWYTAHGRTRGKAATRKAPMSRGRLAMTITILVALLFSKFFYVASLSTYYTFYLIDTFHVSVQAAQLLLFLFLGSFAVGVLIGGPIGDRIGRKYVIWGSILGVLPFTLALPHVGLFWTAVLTVPIGLILASASSSIVVYAPEMVPGKVGTINGLFFGLAFGMGGLGAAVLGKLADMTSIRFVYEVCAYLPAIGILTAFLPNPRKQRAP
ncbi:MAG TPA: MFS transporter [Rhodopila sp.]|uniref:MFS transporter n=1 Tax=Rhodopila sp. TaxID=2480087 RepID=UPI002CFB337C|nr:MFS transporter [Rhodopila sp.]HVY15030.1 MFS transporter [Rhodopila sp.]